MESTRGIFFTFERPDGTGKTTQIARLEMALAERGYETVRTREPGGDFVGEQVRQLLLFAASRAWVREGYLAVAVDEVFTQLWAAVQALLP